MRVTAVVVTYNRLMLLKECIGALLDQDCEDMDILLVDNHSTDGTIEYIKSLLDNEKVEALFLENNLGGAGGFYEGIKYAIKNNTDWLWLMDDDTIPDKNACSELCKAVCIINDRIGFLSSNVYGMNQECMNTPRMNFAQKEIGRAHV